MLPLLISIEKIKILHVEDDPNDAMLIETVIREGFPNADITVVTSEHDFAAEIEKKDYQLILADYHIAGFSGEEALEIAVVKAWAVPFIFVSGTIHEEHAIEFLKTGAWDYVFKDNLKRLIPAISRALADAQKNLETKIQKEKIREMASLVDHSPDSVIIINPAGIIKFANKQAHSVFGHFNGNNLVGRTVWNVLGSEHIGHVSEAFNRVRTLGNWRGDFIIEKNDKSSIHLTCNWTLYEDNQDSGPDIMAIFSDITDQKKMEEKYIRVQRMETIGSISSGLVHDLNNLLSPVLVSMALLKRKVKGDGVALGFISIAEKNITESGNLVKKLMDFLRGELTSCSPLQLEPVVKDVVELMKQTFPKSIKLNIISPDSVLEVLVDPIQVHQVLLNLGINARDAILESGSITFQISNSTKSEKELSAAGLEPGCYVEISVTDTGSGIDEKTMKNLFTPFFTTKGEGKGTGLGLVTIQTIMKRHHGAITVHSIPGKGTTFTVYFPCVKSAVQEKPASNTQQVSIKTDQGKQTILIVDDEPSMIAVSTLFLEENGFNVLSFTDGNEAGQYLTNNHPAISLAVLDVFMPVINGWETAKILESFYPGLPILFVTGETNEKQLQTVLPDSVSVSIFKPFSPETFINAIEARLAKIKI
ncbi:MAG: response regulator [Bacteroidetes bacterium]|nr:response regulator [Bacteroidota bacterium]